MTDSKNILRHLGILTLLLSLGITGLMGCDPQVETDDPEDLDLIEASLEDEDAEGEDADPAGVDVLDFDIVAAVEPSKATLKCRYLGFVQPTLYAGDRVESCDDSRHFLNMQTDGNLVAYWRNANGTHTAKWASNTYGSGANRVVVQSDGNMVLYTASNVAVWSSQTHGHPGAIFEIWGAQWGGAYIFDSVNLYVLKYLW